MECVGEKGKFAKEMFMKRKKIVILLLVFVILIIGNAQRDSIDIPFYEGRSLVIGVIGETPQVREKGHVGFREVTFQQLEDLDLSAELDAVFITKEHLVEASEPKYTKIYHQAEVPFFISSLKNLMSPSRSRNCPTMRFRIFHRICTQQDITARMRRIGVTVYTTV